MKVVSPIDYSSGPCHLETAPRLHDWPQPSAECGWSRRACQSQADQAPAVRLLVPATTARPRAAATTGGSRRGLGADHWRQHAPAPADPVPASRRGQGRSAAARAVAGRDHLVIAVDPRPRHSPGQRVAVPRRPRHSRAAMHGPAHSPAPLQATRTEAGSKRFPLLVGRIRASTSVSMTSRCDERPRDAQRLDTFRRPTRSPTTLGLIRVDVRRWSSSRRARRRDVIVRSWSAVSDPSAKSTATRSRRSRTLTISCAAAVAAGPSSATSDAASGSERRANTTFVTRSSTGDCAGPEVRL